MSATDASEPGDVVDDAVDRGPSWKLWSKRGGTEGYQFGDVSRGLLNQAIPAFRESVVATAKDTAISLQENREQIANRFVSTLMSHTQETEGAEGDARRGSTQVDSADRFWASAKKAVHTPHSAADDPQEGTVVPGCCGALEVEVQAFQESVVLRSDGVEAANPICQLILDGRFSGALTPGSPSGRVRFVFREVFGTDLRLHVFDKGSTRFDLGFEEQSACGGAVIPLFAVIQEVPLKERLQSSRFETTFCVKLLPFEVIRKGKLERAEGTAGAVQPTVPLGHALVRLTVELYEPLWKTCIRDVPPAPPMETTAHNVTTTLETTAAAVARTKLVLDPTVWVEAMTDIRDTWWSAAILLVWWTLMLCSPLWLWPLMLATVPTWLLARSLATRRLTAEASIFLYADEMANPDKDLRLIERGQKAVKEIVKVQQKFQQNAESMNKLSALLEKLMYAAAVNDTTFSMFFALVLIALAVGVTVQLLVLMLSIASGFWRHALWFGGVCLFLPEVPRSHVRHKIHHAIENRPPAVQQAQQAFKSIWHRIPDAVEACHLELFRRYVLEKR